MRFFTIVVGFLMLCGCTSTLKREDVSHAGSPLERGGLTVIASPQNGSYGGSTYSASGGETAAKYYAVPEILHWEDRATEWSGIKDKLEIKLTVYEAARPAPVASTVLSGKSKFMTFGGDHPQDLLPALIGAYVQSLYAR
jgi:hypothetical protein